MDTLKQKFSDKALQLREEIKNIKKEHGNTDLGKITLDQVYSGMKGMIGLVYETSSLDPEEGIRFRGYSIPELRDKLPKIEGGVEPLPEGIFYLMLIGELPTQDDVNSLTRDWAKRSQEIPQHVFSTLDALPETTHPMTQFTIGIMAMQTKSKFAEAYRKGVSRYDLWEHMYEDVMDLIASLPVIASYIYRRTYKNNEQIKPDASLDWAGNFAHMLGYGDNNEFKRLMRLYLTIHADHEGGNVSAHTTRLVGSALSDAYLSFAAAMNGLAGPLHGLANQEVIRWILGMQEEIGNDPSKEEIENYIRKTLDQGRVVPGYGHAVLRKTDPRFTAQRDFAMKYMPDDELIKIVGTLYEVVPGILEETGKVKNPWPNVDAHSGALLLHYGMKEYDFYTVLFGVSRALGVLASLVWDRALMLPLERPKSVTTEFLKSKIGIN